MDNEIPNIDAPGFDASAKRPNRPCIISGCILSIPILLLLLPFIMVGVVMLNWAYRDIPRSGENLPKAEQYSPEASNYSFYNRLLHQVCEFDIPEAAFWEMCEKESWRPIPIETLKELPPPEYDDDDEWPKVNTERSVPVGIRRYVWDRPEHENCSPNYECELDPGGKGENSCHRVVSKGYYFEARASDGGGMKMLYDSETGRCYIHTSPH